MRFIIGIPILFSVAAFVLAMLALFAGNKPGFMEDYHIIMLNTSEFGRNIVPTPSSGGNTPTTTSGGSGIGGFVSGLVHSATAAVGTAVGAVESELASIENDIADELAAKLGIKQFYSLHAMDSCEGYFTPNATTPNAGYNVTNCTTPLKTGQMNISALLDHELSVGPVHLDLADLQFSQDLQHEFDKIPGLLLALAIFYILGAAFSGLSILAAAAGLAVYHRRPVATAAANVAVSSVAALTLLVANLITTKGGKDAADAINKFGKDIGLVATTGPKFTAITWTAFALMLVTAGYWAFELSTELRARKKGRPRKAYEMRQSSLDYSPPRAQQQPSRSARRGWW